MAYYLKPLTKLANIKIYPIRVTVDGATYEEHVSIFVMVNGSTVGNFDNFLDMADMSDGIMEMVLITEASTMDNLSLFRAILAGEDITTHKNIKLLRGRKFTIDCNCGNSEKMPITLDGEKGPLCPLEIEVIHNAVKVYIPKV